MREKMVDLAKKLGVGYRLDEGGERLLMGTVCEVRELSLNDSSVIAAVATESPSARDGAVLRVGGVKLAKYRKNPVVLWAHDYSSRPVGTSEWERLEKRDGLHVLTAKAAFHRKTDLSAEVWELIKLDVLRAWSVGFMVGDYGELIADTKEDAADMVDEESICRPRYEIRTWELMEYSSCPVPADAESLTLGIRALHERGVSLPVLEHKLRDAGFQVPSLVPREVRAEEEVIIEGDGEYVVPAETDEGKDGVEPNDVPPEDGGDGTEPARQVGDAVEEILDEMIEDEIARVEETEDYIHVPVRGKGQFRPDTIRTWDISKKEGIQAVGGKLKKNEGEEEDPMVVQKYLFAKEKGWTVEKAKKWVEDHAKSVDNWLAEFAEHALEPEQFAFEVSDEGRLWPFPTGEFSRGAISYHDYGAGIPNHAERKGKEISAKNARDLRAWAQYLRETADGLDELAGRSDPKDEEKKVTAEDVLEVVGEMDVRGLVRRGLGLGR